MALGDYILCCKCEVKLIYDGDRGQREWWKERFGKPLEIECPDCKAPASKPCKGIPRKGCNYLTACDTVCNKCGEVHHHHQMVANFDAPASKPFVGLTNQELIDLTTIYSGAKLYCAIEAKLREKNT